MKMSIVIDFPENEMENIKYPEEPFNIEVKLDYGDKTLYLDGKIEQLKG